MHSSSIQPLPPPTSSGYQKGGSKSRFNRTVHPVKVKDYFDDDDDDNGEISVKEPHNQHGDDDLDDPLDSFMNNIQQQIQQQSSNVALKSTSKQLPDIVSGSIDDYEDYEDYGQTTMVGVGMDDDTDLNKRTDGADGSKARIEPLPPIDHSTIEYKPFRKDFYSHCIPPEISSLSDDELEELLQRSELHIQSYKVSRQQLPRPITTFKQTGFDRQLLHEINALGFNHPTPIQSLAIPVALTGYDLIALAKTGSGKTFAYLWPMITHILDQPQMQLGEGPIGLVLVPTRELATQVYTESKKFIKCYNIRSVPIYGGEGKYEMSKALKEAPEMVIATPGRFIEMVQNKSTNLRRCTMIVLDEADRMFEMGFEYQVRSIVNNVRPDKQILMFSATMKKKIEGFAREICRNEVRVVVGKTGQANEDIQQIAHVMPNDAAKWLWLSNNIDLFASEGKVLIFVLQKQDTEVLVTKLKTLFEARRLYISVDCLHGDKDQSDRTRIMAQFRVVNNNAAIDSTAATSTTSTSAKSSLTILVATDIAARGLDVKDIRTVINYDVAKNIETYIHRIGRTGRLGIEGVTPGTAYTLLTNKDSSFAVDLVQNLNLSKQSVAKELQILAESDPKWARIRHIQFGGSTHHNHSSMGSSKSHGVGRSGLGFGRTPAVAMTSAMLANQWGDRSTSSSGTAVQVGSEAVRHVSVGNLISKSSTDDFAANPYLEGRSHGRGKHLTQPSWVEPAVNNDVVGSNDSKNSENLDDVIIERASTFIGNPVIHGSEVTQQVVKRKSRFADVLDVIPHPEDTSILNNHSRATVLPGFVRSSGPSPSTSSAPSSATIVTSSESRTQASSSVLPGFVRSTAPSAPIFTPHISQSNNSGSALYPSNAVATSQGDQMKKRSRWGSS